MVTIYVLKLDAAKKADKTLMGISFVKYILFKYYNIDITYFSYNSQGKPYLKDYIYTHFNLSHSDDYVVCAVSNYAVGIDIEKIKDDNPLELAKIHFERAQYKDIKKSTNPLRRFYQLLTVKESYLKYRGERLGASDLMFKIDDNEISVNEKVAYYKSYDLPDDYVLTVCGFADKFNDDFIYINYDYQNKTFQ